MKKFFQIAIKREIFVARFIGVAVGAVFVYFYGLVSLAQVAVIGTLSVFVLGYITFLESRR